MVVPLAVTFTVGYTKNQEQKKLTKMSKRRNSDDTWDGVEVLSGEGTANPKVRLTFSAGTWWGGAARCKSHFLGTGGCVCAPGR